MGYCAGHSSCFQRAIALSCRRHDASCSAVVSYSIPIPDSPVDGLMAPVAKKKVEQQKSVGQLSGSVAASILKSAGEVVVDIISSPAVSKA